MNSRRRSTIVNLVKSPPYKESSTSMDQSYSYRIFAPFFRRPEKKVWVNGRMTRYRFACHIVNPCRLTYTTVVVSVCGGKFCDLGWLYNWWTPMRSPNVAHGVPWLWLMDEASSRTSGRTSGTQPRPLLSRTVSP